MPNERSPPFQGRYLFPPPEGFVAMLDASPETGTEVLSPASDDVSAESIYVTAELGPTTAELEAFQARDRQRRIGRSDSNPTKLTALAPQITTEVDDPVQGIHPLNLIEGYHLGVNPIEEGNMLSYNRLNLELIDPDYEILKPEKGPLRGGQGFVFKAVHRVSREVVAVKFVLENLHKIGVSPDTVIPPSKEFAIHSMLSKDDGHPHIASAMYTNEGKKDLVDTKVQVMEWMSGGTLGDLLKKYAPEGASEEEAKHLIAQVMKAVYYMHSKNVFHRDLKPENIMLCQKVDNILDAHLKVIDFGIAGYLDNEKDRQSGRGGTGVYAPPENWDVDLLARVGCDGRVDVWGVGILLYRTIFGHIPGGDVTNPNIKLKALDGKRSELLIHLLKGMLTRNPEERFTVRDVLHHPWFRSSPVGGTTGYAKAEKPQKKARESVKRKLDAGDAVESSPLKKSKAQ